MSRRIPVAVVVAFAAILVALLVGRQYRSSPAASAGPRERVAGVQGIQQPRSTPEAEKVDVAALNAAADYAAAHDSTALIVSRHGHVIFERYWDGTSRDTVVDAGAFGRTVAAMLVGVALDQRHIASADEPVSSFVDSFAGEGRGRTTIRELLQMDDPRSLALLVQQLSGKRYAAALSRELWRPLSAGDAWVVLDGPDGLARVDCCFFAKQGDWMRVAQLLLDDGEYQGSRILPRGWARQLMLPSARDPAEGSQLKLGIPRDGLSLEGEGRSRLWLHPGLHLAVLRLGREPAQKWDEARIPSLVVAGVIDRPAAPPSANEVDLSRLVPHH